MVDMAHDGHDRRTALELFRQVLNAVFRQILFLGEAHLFHFIAEFGGYDGGRVDVQRLVDGRHDAEVEQHLDDFIGLQAHLVSHVRHTDGFFDADLALSGLDGLRSLRHGTAGILGPPASASARHIIHILVAAAPGAH